jgi:hypothetical protein
MDAIATERHIGSQERRDAVAYVTRDAASEKGGYLPHLPAQLDPVTGPVARGRGTGTGAWQVDRDAY